MAPSVAELNGDDAVRGEQQSKSSSAFAAPPLVVKQPSHEEMVGCMAACFEWADSYDSKVRRSSVQRLYCSSSNS